MDTLKINMDMLAHAKTVLLEFDKEANQIFTKYAPYRERADEVMDFNCPIKEEFIAWKGRYLERVVD